MNAEERQAIIDRVAASPFPQAIDELCDGVRLVWPDAKREDIDRLAPLFSAALVRAIEQVAQTGAATFGALDAKIDAFQKECQGNHTAIMDALLSLSDRTEGRLRTLEAGKDG